MAVTKRNQKQLNNKQHQHKVDNKQQQITRYLGTTTTTTTVHRIEQQQRDENGGTKQQQHQTTTMPTAMKKVQQMEDLKEHSARRKEDRHSWGEGWRCQGKALIWNRNFHWPDMTVVTSLDQLQSA